MDREIVIRTSALTKKYEETGTVAVDGLSLDIFEGEVFGLLGPNGAGKTTTILMLLGLTEPTSGSASVLGRDCVRESLAIKRAVGYLPDNVGFYNDMTGFANLRFIGRLNELSEDDIVQRSRILLERVGLTDVADKRVATYSKGMKQRLAIADILMKDPKVIILDEPTLGIDPEGMRELLTLIRGLSVEDGRTVVVSSHQLQQIQQICDRVGIFVEGKLIACGEISELAKKLNEDGNVLIELGADPAGKELEDLISGLDSVNGVERENDLLIISSKDDIRRELPDILSKRDYRLSHLRMRSGDLDEIYHRYFEKEGKTDGRGRMRDKSKPSAS